MARCVGITDGDTITVLAGAERTRIRLEGVDAPERGQPFSNRSRQFVSALVSGRVVRILPRETDRYGRLVARVRVDDLDLSLELVRAGLAWHYKRYSSDPALAAAELQARTERLGLWSVTDPIPPWEMKRRNTAKPNLR
jgi:micrococcal nuclease